LALDKLPEGRQPGTRSSGSIKFMRATPSSEDLSIPEGTMVAMPSEDGQLISFQTTERSILHKGDTFCYAPAQALDIGISGNVGTGTITLMLTPVFGISSITNDAPFEGGTDQESDDDLRLRYLYTIWVPGKATIPMVTEHVSGLNGVREVKVSTLGQGDVLVVIDADLESKDIELNRGLDNEDFEPNLEDQISGKLYTELAAGCTAPGVLGASLRGPEVTFQIGDSSGAPVWVRSLEYIPEQVAIPFVYLTPEGSSQNGLAVFPGGSPAGFAVQAILSTPKAQAGKIMSSTYSGDYSFDIFMGRGEYPYLWVGPERQKVDVDLRLVLNATPEVDLLVSIQASLKAKLSSYKIGEPLEYADLVKYIYVDFGTGRAFSGIDDILAFSLSCKGISLSKFGDKVILDLDERLEAGVVKVAASA
jgi:hypothetical protein